MTMVNPYSRLTMGGVLDILSLARIHGVKISVCWFEEKECYVLTVFKGDCSERVYISNSELDAAKNDELFFRNKIHYAIHVVTSKCHSTKEKKHDS